MCAARRARPTLSTVPPFTPHYLAELSPHPPGALQPAFPALIVVTIECLAVWGHCGRRKREREGGGGVREGGSGELLTGTRHRRHAGPSYVATVCLLDLMESNHPTAHQRQPAQPSPFRRGRCFQAAARRQRLPLGQLSCKQLSFRKTACAATAVRCWARQGNLAVPHERGLDRYPRVRELMSMGPVWHESSRRSGLNAADKALPEGSEGPKDPVRQPKLWPFLQNART